MSEKLYPVKVTVSLDDSGDGEATCTLNGLLYCYNLTRSSGSPDVTISDGYATPVDGVTFAADGQFHPEAPIVDSDGTDTGLKALYLFSQAHEVTITVSGGDTTNGTVTLEFFMVSI